MWGNCTRQGERPQSELVAARLPAVRYFPVYQASLICLYCNNACASKCWCSYAGFRPEEDTCSGVAALTS